MEIDSSSSNGRVDLDESATEDTFENATGAVLQHKQEQACRAAKANVFKPHKLHDLSIFVADTGAICHIKTNTQGMTNLKKIQKTVRMGQSSVKIIFQGDYECEAQQVDGTVLHLKQAATY